MKKYTFYLVVLGLIFAYNPGELMAQGAQIECGTTETVNVSVPAHTSTAGGNQNLRYGLAVKDHKEWLEAYINANGANGATCEGAGTPGSCKGCVEEPGKNKTGCDESIFFPNAPGLEDGYPKHGGSDPDTFRFAADPCMEVQTTCTECITHITQNNMGPITPSGNTMAACDGTMNMTTLTIEKVHLTNIPAITMTQAKQIWIDWIVSLNGTGFPATLPWGCTSCGIPEEAGCMTVDESLSSPVPDPVLVGDNWEFPFVSSYDLVYSCSPCGMKHDLQNVPENLINEMQLHTLYPNPASESIRAVISIPETGNVEITITDALGKVIITKAVKASGQTHQSVNLSLNELAAGLYHFNLLIDKQPIRSAQFTVQNR